MQPAAEQADRIYTVNQAKLRELADDAKGKRSNLVSGASTSGGAALSRDGTANPSIVASANVPLDAIPKEALIYCTFSFTIRRDAYHSASSLPLQAGRTANDMSCSTKCDSRKLYAVHTPVDEVAGCPATRKSLQKGSESEIKQFVITIVALLGTDYGINASMG